MIHLPTLNAHHVTDAASPIAQDGAVLPRL